MNEIMSISRLRMGIDGAGVTTLVTFHGCPLHCHYCLNPQCRIDSTIRARYTVDELIEVLEIDDLYFRMTCGGITFGGGEPLLNSEFIKEFCEKVGYKWRVRIESSLNVAWEEVELLAGCIDQWIVDVKDMNPERYEQYTGMSNRQVISNLSKLRKLVGQENIRVRVPQIPGYNSEQDVENSLQKLKKFYNIDKFTYRDL